MGPTLPRGATGYQSCCKKGSHSLWCGSHASRNSVLSMPAQVALVKSSGSQSKNKVNTKDRKDWWGLGREREGVGMEGTENDGEQEVSCMELLKNDSASCSQTDKEGGLRGQGSRSLKDTVACACAFPLRPKNRRAHDCQPVGQMHL